MKKILFLMAILPMMLFTACSSDDDKNDYESALIGLWIEDTEGVIEVFHLDLKSDHTGYFWATDNGKIDTYGKRSLVWSATEHKLTVTYEGKATESLDYQIAKGKLYLGEIVYAKH